MTNPSGEEERNPPSKTFIFAGASLLAMAGIAFFMWPWQAQRRGGDGAASLRPVAAAPSSSSSLPAGKKTEAGKPAPGPRRSAEEMDAIKAEIEDATVQYSPDTLPQFSQWLRDPSQEIRKAAANGLLQSGLEGGAPLLREAAQAAADPEEADEYRQAAGILELPPATEEIAASLRASGSTQPPAGIKIKPGGENEAAGGK